MGILDRWKEFMNKMNQKGVPVPMVRSPDTGIASVSLTLVFVSFNVCIAGLIGKWAGFLGGIDVNQSITLFSICAGLYWGRKFQSDGKNITLDVDHPPVKPKDP